MSYIGNAKSPLIFGPNTRDDIVPDGTKTIFDLSQEVPGGYEENITVIRQKYITRSVVKNTTNLVFENNVLGDQISTTDQDLAAALSRFAPGDFLIIAGPSSVDSLGTYGVTAVDYNGTDISITVDGNILPADSGDVNVEIIHGYYDNWEVLQPGTDYTISGIGSLYNKQIGFSSAPKEEEKIYVLHRGEATYNFVPTAGSVGPDQLQQNLRNFVVDRHTGTGSQVNFSLSQPAIDSKSLLVTVDGVIVDGDSLGFSSGTWSLTETSSGSGIFDRITFDVAPAVGKIIRILHLGFSTVSRRALYSPNQSALVVPPSSVGSYELQNDSVTSAKLVDGSVISTKIADDAVNGSKILLNNNQALRSKNSSGTAVDLVKLNTSNSVVLTSPTNFSINGDIIPASPKDLGTTANPFKELHLNGPIKVDESVVGQSITIDSGNISTPTLNVTGDITVGGVVDGVDISDLEDRVQLLEFGFPIGGIIQFGGETAPPGWLLCDGSSYSSSLYPSLYSVIGVKYGGVAGTSFNVPDLRRRIPIGKSASAPTNILGATGGQFDHIHELPDHTHDDSHTHLVPAHHHEHNISNGSNLAITVNSGTHSTSTSHTHTTFSTSLTEGSHEHVLGSVGDTSAVSRQVFASSEQLAISGILSARNPAHTHGLSGTTSANSVNHTHAADAITETGTGLANHTHSVSTIDIERAGNIGSSTNYHFVIGTVSSGLSSDKNLRANSANYDGDHDHDLTVTTTTESASHTHNLSSVSISTTGSTHDHVVRGTVPGTNSSHQHTINIPAFTGNSSSNGEHTHPTGSFTGKIGKVTGGVSGDSNITSLGRSTNTTGQISAPGPGTSFSANPPYIVLNYIIKI